MPRQVLSISSQVAYGPVGNSASVPALQAAGFTVSQIPTIILSNHPGLGKPSGVKLPAAELEAILKSLDALGVLDTCLGVMTGYFASADQIKVAASFIHKMKDKNPSSTYWSIPCWAMTAVSMSQAKSPTPSAMSCCLWPPASPPIVLNWAGFPANPFPIKQRSCLRRQLFPTRKYLQPQFPLDANNLATLAITGSEYAETSSPIKPSVPHGTGDFLAGLYFAARLNGFESREALKLSSGILDSAISRSLGQPCLDIIGALHNPS